MLKDSAQDIKFGPKHLGLVLAAAMTNGVLKIFKWADPNQLNSYIEMREINLFKFHGECTCLDWNPSFDEPMSLIVGGVLTSAPQAPGSPEGSKEGEEELKPHNHLLKLVILDQAEAKNDRVFSVNGNPSLGDSGLVAGHKMVKINSV